MKKYILGLSVLVLVFSVVLSAPQKASAELHSPPRQGDTSGGDTLCHDGLWHPTGHCPGGYIMISPDFGGDTGLTARVETNTSFFSTALTLPTKENLNQTFNLEVIEFPSGNTFFTKTGISDPTFNVPGLDNNMTYVYRLIPVNSSSTVLPRPFYPLKDSSGTGSPKSGGSL